MARPKGTADIAPMIRGAFIRAAKMLEEDGKPLSLIIKDQLEERPLDTLKAISSFVPKEMLIDADITTQLDELSEAGLDAEIRRLVTLTGIAVASAGETEKIRH